MDKPGIILFCKNLATTIKQNDHLKLCWITLIPL